MIALVIIHNHRYDANIPRLDEIYKSRFSHIFHLVPFYDGDRSNVITIYENSHYFQGYVAQAYERLTSEGNFDHFIFIGDDLILNPQINQDNYTTYFKVGKEDSFISSLDELHSLNLWYHSPKAVDYDPFNVPGVEVKREFPSKEDVLKEFEKKGFEKPYLNADKVYELPPRCNYPKNLKGLIRYKLDCRKVNKQLRKGRIELNFPLMSGYSDIFILPVSDFKQFRHYSGLFVATNLFVELAIPTAMIMACKKIITEKDLQDKGIALWTKEDKQALEDTYERSLDKLFSTFPSDVMYYHPIKLSRWT